MVTVILPATKQGDREALVAALARLALNVASRQMPAAQQKKGAA